MRSYTSLSEDELKDWKAWPDSLFGQREKIILEFDTSRRLTRVSNPSDHDIYSIDYNIHGIEKMVHPERGIEIIYIYSPNGQLDHALQKQNGFFTAEWDHHYQDERLVRVIHSSASRSDTVKWELSYDSSGRIVRVECSDDWGKRVEEFYYSYADRDSTITWTEVRHDPMSERVQGQISEVTRVEHNAKSTLRNPDGSMIKKNYSDHNHRTEYWKDGKMNRLQVADYLEEVYSYNQSVHISGIRLTIQGRVSEFTFQYIYDEYGNPLRILKTSTNYISPSYSYTKFEGAWLFKYAYW